MFVVLDSNILFRDFHFRRPHLKLVRDQAAAGEFKLAVPEVVVLETVNLYRRELTKTVEKLAERVQKPLARLTELEIELEAPTVDVAARVEAYEESLRELLEEVDAEVPDLPGVPEADVVARAIGKRKPFKSTTDAGYRDTLIWHNVLALAAEDEVVLVSGNDADFAEADDPSNLAGDLRDDLEAAGLARDRVQLLPDAASFVKRYVAESVQVRHTVQQGLADRDSEIFSRLETLVAEAAHGYAPSFPIPGVREFGTDELTLPYSADEDGVSVEYVDELRDVEVLDARVDGDTAVLELSVIAQLTISFFVPKWELWQLDEDSTPEASVLDRDWSEHYAWVEATPAASLKLVASFDVSANELTSVEVVRVADA